MFITVVSFILLMTGGTRIIYVIFTLIASIPHIYQIMIINSNLSARQATCIY
jgi:hypothetical protein